MEQLKSHSKAGRHKYVSFISVCFVPIVLPLLRRCPPLFNFTESSVLHATWFVRRMLQFSILASMLCNHSVPRPAGAGTR